MYEYIVEYMYYDETIVIIIIINIIAKYNECESQVPKLAALEEITHQDISNTTFLSYELWTLKRMGWKLHGKDIYITIYFVIYL